MIQLVCCYKPLHMEELYLMSADTVGKYVLYVNTHHCLCREVWQEWKNKARSPWLKAGVFIDEV